MVEARARKNDTEMFEMLDSIRARRVMLKDLRPSTYAIRHDIDDRLLKNSIFLARAENRKGVRSTYFFNHDRAYFDYSDDFLDKLKEFVALGHDLGFHNNAVAISLRDGGSPHDLVLKALDFMRQAGEVVGTSTHGDASCAKLKFLNFDMWEECQHIRKSDPAQLPIEIHSLKEVGLEYEAYNLKFTHYLSDNGGMWSGKASGGKVGAPGSIPGFERTSDPENATKLRDYIINDFNATPAGILQILMHPQHWVVTL